MILALDVQYAPARSFVAGVLFSSWSDDAPAATHTHIVEGPPAGYEPGAFYQRELPVLLSLIETLETRPHTIVIDGYVWLSDDRRKGLGAHLYEALGGDIPVIGVAKTAFKGSDFARPVLRGESQRPLYVTAIGLLAEDAAAHIAAMHGAHRIPTLLKQVDALARSGVSV